MSLISKCSCGRLRRFSFGVRDIQSCAGFVQPGDYTVPRSDRRAPAPSGAAWTGFGSRSLDRKDRPEPDSMTKNPAHSTPKSNHQIAQMRLHYFEQQRDHMIDIIRRLVEIESPSDNKQAVDRCSAFAAEEFAALGGRAQFHRVAGLRQSPAGGLPRRDAAETCAAAGPLRHGVSAGNADHHAVPPG